MWVDVVVCAENVRDVIRYGVKVRLGSRCRSDAV
jgi:hypothetical protein